MDNNSDLIHFSRAGDIFHYRWAVKRCLKLLDFNTNLTHITIEGSKESKLAGECVVDLAEYRKSEKGIVSIEYFQLKHSTVRVEQPFTPSQLKDTLKGFADRYLAIQSSGKQKISVAYTVLTNRKISDNFKRNIRKIAKGDKAPPVFTKNLKEYTKLDDDNLKSFCQRLNLNDSEGNYESQKLDIHKELHHLAVSKNVSNREKLLVAKVWEKIEPGNSKVIKQEDMLEAFDAISMDDFFPAPPLFEPMENYVPREQQTSIVNSIKNAKTHTIITASGGVGKSILSSNMATEFEESSVVIPYDCFGNGSYRRVSSQRHEVKHAYAQVINTLATLGFCDQVIPSRNEPDDHWAKLFLNRVSEACRSLKSQDSNAFLVLIFDAADNAEMAAEEHGSKCFANQLLKESVPDNCRLVFTCRPERLHLLDPPSSIQKIELFTFSNEEALANLQEKYPSPTKEQAIEFNRLTGGNPRVQSNALSLKEKSLERLLLSFSSQVVTVEDLIERQLEHSIAKIKDSFPKNYRDSVDNICTGLAVLPPFVPIDILAAVAGVSTDAVKSFISDLGHPLWQIDETVQFRDEPTEKWFQDHYIPTPEKIAAFIEDIKPLVSEFPYVSEALPVLLLKANKLDELVQLALSTDYLPSISEYDDIQVKVKRLQYAFKAALKANKTYEAVKLALLAGEEIAGNNRQLDILKNNIDLTSIFLAPARVQEIAHRKEISGGWDGSETVYSASLLSTVSSLNGEAQSYFRSANHWLHRYFERRDEAKDEEERFNEKLDNLEILELAHTVLRIKGFKQCADFLVSWTPPSCIFKTTSSIIERLIDIGDFETIELMANYRKENPSYVVAITSELMKVGRTPPRSCLTRCLNKIIKPSSKLDKPGDDIHDVGFSSDAYLSFFEACVLNNLPLANIRRGINYYYEVPMLYRVEEAHQWRGARENFLRFLSLQAIFKNDFSLDFEEFIPKSWHCKKTDYEGKRELGRVKDIISKLIPWYMVRAKILTGRHLDLKQEHDKSRSLSSKTGDSAYREYEPVPYEITKAKFQNIMLCDSNCAEELEVFLKNYTDNNLKVKFLDELYFLRVTCRTNKFQTLSAVIEENCYSSINTYDYDESPESRSENFITLSRAVLSEGKEDAEAYFDLALNKASDFGEEAVIRWEALTSIAKQYSIEKNDSPELAHRYMRCAEMIGDSVDREKYWDRNDAVKTCFQLSPLSAFPILHRWKDRSVGWHDRLINPLVHSAIDSGDVSPATIWSLSAFSWEYGLDELLEKVLNAEPVKEIRQLMLDSYTQSLRAKGVTGNIWLKVNNLANKYQLSSLPNEELNSLSEVEKPDEKSFLKSRKVTEDKDNYSWEEIFGCFDLLTENGLGDAYQKLQEQGFPRRVDEFWQGCFQKVTQKKLVEFLNVIAQSEYLDFSSLSWAFEQIPEEWKKKPAVQRQWNSIITQIATRFPRDFTNIYKRHYTAERFSLDDQSDVAIAQGVVAGLSNSVDIESASALFSFANFSANKLTVDQAKDLIDFGLNRLEQFIDEDYADGKLDETRQLPTSLEQAIACYIYANLGSPHSEERWRAVHAVVRLYNLREQAAIDNLIECLKAGLPTSYIPTKYDFYDLHAKLYLLVALTRCVNATPELLVTHASLMAKIATNKQQGILFQYYAKQICLKLKNYQPCCFEKEMYNQVQKACVSPFSTLSEDKYRFTTDTPWHTSGSLASIEDINFDYDFEKNRLAPLSRVFGVPMGQVKDLAGDIYINRWKQSLDTSHKSDTRAGLWKSRRYPYNAYHSRFSFPDIDTKSFYTEYHLLLEVASKLLESMPALKGYDDGISAWDEWFKEYLILNDNKMLLAELRNPMPTDKPKWTNEKADENWQWQIQESDFLDFLVKRPSVITWLNVEGSWNHYKDGKNEEVSFSSILVPKHLSQSLLHTTCNYSNHLNEVYLCNFCESEYGEEYQEFNCLEWLISEDRESELEQKDPLSGTIQNRPMTVANCVSNSIEVTYSDSKKKCMLLLDNSLCLENTYWSEDKPNDSDTYISSGHPVQASLSFLKLMCNKMNVDIAIQVNIKRTYTGSYRNRNNDDELGYIPNYSKTFILSGDGQLRDTRKSYKLG